MTVLVLGTPNSGKSELAEELAMKTGDDQHYYLATMKIYDEEGKKRILRHRQKREGKGFFTIEQEYGITEVLAQIENPAKATVLLECVSNLVGNELFENPERAKMLSLGYAKISQAECARFADEVFMQIKTLAERFHHLILVSNQFEPEQDSYDDQTRLYVKLMELVNQRLTAFADRIYDLRKGKA